jgi:Transglutaminase-like superfamily
MSTSAADPKHFSRLRALVRHLSRPADAWLAVRAAWWMCTLLVLKRTLPLPRLVRLMWLPPRISERDPERVERTIRIVARLSRASGGNCLARSLVLYRYLSRAWADPRLVVGMAKPDELLGHVWVTVEGRPLLETRETLESYTDVVSFGGGGAQES